MPFVHTDLRKTLLCESLFSELLIKHIPEKEFRGTSSNLNSIFLDALAPATTIWEGPCGCESSHVVATRPSSTSPPPPPAPPPLAPHHQARHHHDHLDAYQMSLSPPTFTGSSNSSPSSKLYSTNCPALSKFYTYTYNLCVNVCNCKNHKTIS